MDSKREYIPDSPLVGIGFVVGLLAVIFVGVKRDAVFQLKHSLSEKVIIESELVLKRLKDLEESFKEKKEHGDILEGVEKLPRLTAEEEKEIAEIDKDVVIAHRNWLEEDEGTNPENVVKMLNEDSKVLMESGKKALALERSEHAYIIAPKNVDVLNQLGISLGKNGKYDSAEEKFNKALEYVDGPKEKAVVLSSLANMLQLHKKYKKAEVLYRKVLLIGKEIYKEDHPYIAATTKALVEVLRAQGKKEEAKKYSE